LKKSCSFNKLDQRSHKQTEFINMETPLYITVTRDALTPSNFIVVKNIL